MRELKFRVWDHKRQYFVNEKFDDVAMYIKFDGSLTFISTVGGEMKVKGEYTVQQYTGLKDKNGKEFYEGDIVKLFNDPDELYEVVYNDFDNDIVGFLLESDGGRGDWFDSRKREVVGNIFENPELIK